MSQRFHCKKGGFTLIELLVVIAIISLLVSILLPSLTKAKDLARKTICQTQLRSFHMAFMFFANDNDGQVPQYYVNPLGDLDSDWSSYIVSYLDLPRFNSYDGGNHSWVTQPGESIFRCPGRDVGIGADYGLNAEVVVGPLAVPARPLYRISDEQNSANTLRLGDSTNWFHHSELTYNLAVFPDIHIGGANFLFLDGHIEWLEAALGVWGWDDGEHRIVDHYGS